MGWTKPLEFKKKEKKFDTRWRAVNRSFFGPSFSIRSFSAHTLKHLYDSNISVQAKFNTFT